MKITQLDIEGFRSLKKVSWKPGDLNIVISPNGSGKSNLLRMLELISSAARGRLNRYITENAGINSLLWDGHASSILFRLNTGEDEFTYDAEISRLGYGSSYTISQEKLRNNILDNTYLERADNHISVFTNDEERAVRPDFVPDGELALSYVINPFSNDSSLIDFQGVLSSWTVYQELRVDQNAEIRRDAVARYETTISADGQNLINVLHTLYTGDRDFKQHINDAMHAAFGEDFDEIIFPPTSDQRVQLRIRWKTLQREQSAADLSDGTLRFLFLLAVLASPTPAPLIAIDEPETGLHPSMLPIIAALAVDAAERTQVVFTTHSDQFLDAFQDTRPTTTVARWENGETTLMTLSDEDLAYWLKDYSLGRMYRSGELEALA